MKILVWGTGSYAEYFLNKTDCLEGIHGFVSNSQPSTDFISKYAEQKPVYSSSELKNLSYDILIVAVLSEVYMQEIYDECLHMGLAMEKIVFLPRLLDFRDPLLLNDAEKVVYGMFKKSFAIPISFFDLINYWRSYYYKNFEQIYEKKTLLLRNLDDESQEVVDTLLERNFKMLPLLEYKDVFLWDLQQVMSEAERMLLHSNYDWERKVREKYKLLATLPLEFSVFHYSCGLSFVPEEALRSLHGKDFIDGGAFWGDSAVVLNEFSPATIHCFEPFPRNYERLKAIISERDLTNIIPVKMGVGNSSSHDVSYYHSASADTIEQVVSTATCLAYVDSQFDMQTSQIEVVTIDDYVRTNKLNVGLIKLDIEGKELEAIQGALETIKAFRPILLVSIYHTPEDLFEIKPLLEGLNMDYKFLIRHLTYWPNTEVMLIAY